SELVKSEPVILGFYPGDSPCEPIFSLMALFLVLSLALLSPVFAAPAPGPASVVNVTLEDTSTNGTMGNMHMSLDQNIVKAGQVTFYAVNQSKTLVHEAIVVKVDPKNKALPYNAKKGVVIESRI